VQEQALQLAEESLKRARRELELGATPELEIYQPEQQAATARIGVVQVQYQIKQFEDNLRRQIGADLDPAFQMIPVVLTEDVSKPPDETVYDQEQMVHLALQNRPDLMSLRTSLEVNDLQIESAMNQLKPLLNFQGSYATQGRGGTARLRPGSPGYPANGTGGVVIIPGGIGDSFSQWFNFNTFAFSLNLQLPIRDRAGSAGLADAVVNKRLNAMRERNIEQQLRQEVLNALTQVESSREGVKLARIALEFAEKRVEADQKRYDLGVIQIFFLLSAQTDLTQAQSNLVNQTVQYKRNLLVLQQRLGTLLEDKGLVLQ
jgi:outer membrane protein